MIQIVIMMRLKYRNAERVRRELADEGEEGDVDVEELKLRDTFLRLLKLPILALICTAFSSQFNDEILKKKLLEKKEIF